MGSTAERARRVGGRTEGTTCRVYDRRRESNLDRYKAFRATWLAY